jgi:glycerol uptake facilitator-like aquaporin
MNKRNGGQQLTESEKEAKARRRRFMWRACFGEFMATLIFLTPIFGAACNSYVQQWDRGLTSFVLAFIAGIQSTAVIFTFSTISGAQRNCGITFTLWLTGKLSNRKTILYLIVQVTASICAMLIVRVTFTNPTRELLQSACIIPDDDADEVKIFLTEFFTTFLFTYVAFSTAYDEAESQKRVFLSLKEMAGAQGLTLFSSSPLSKVGFAPFAIGFADFSLTMFGGTNGVAMNPARMIGPAIIGHCWKSLHIYVFADIVGACCGGSAVYIFHIVTEEDGPGLKYYGEKNVIAWILLQLSYLCGRPRETVTLPGTGRESFNNKNSRNHKDKHGATELKDHTAKNPIV